MKKLLLTIIILGAIGSYWYYAKAATVVVDSYTQTPSFDARFWGITGQGQAFNASQNATLTGVSFRLKKIGTPAATTMVAKLYTTTGTYGSNARPNTLLATSDTVNVSTLTTSYATSTFTFSGVNQYALTSGTKYAIQLDVNTTGDATNAVVAGIVNPTGTHSGNWFTYDGLYVTSSDIDMVFEVVGEESAPTVSTISDLVLFE